MIGHLDFSFPEVEALTDRIRPSLPSLPSLSSLPLQLCKGVKPLKSNGISANFKNRNMFKNVVGFYKTGLEN
jgi:hypothetical protein